MVDENYFYKNNMKSPLFIWSEDNLSPALLIPNGSTVKAIRSSLSPLVKKKGSWETANVIWLPSRR